VDFKIKNIDVGDEKIKLQIWDTAGEERFRTITNSYYRGSHGIIVVYDVTNKESFENIDSWFKTIQGNVEYKPTTLIVGTKTDLEDQIQVTQEMAQEKADLFKSEHVRVSSKSKPDSVNDAFYTLIKKIRAEGPAGIQGIRAQRKIPMATLTKELEETQSRCFCWARMP